VRARMFLIKSWRLTCVCLSWGVVLHGVEASALATMLDGRVPEIDGMMSLVLSTGCKSAGHLAPYLELKWSNNTDGLHRLLLEACVGYFQSPPGDLSSVIAPLVSHTLGGVVAPTSIQVRKLD